MRSGTFSIAATRHQMRDRDDMDRLHAQQDAARRAEDRAGRARRHQASRAHRRHVDLMLAVPTDSEREDNADNGSPFSPQGSPVGGSLGNAADGHHTAPPVDGAAPAPALGEAHVSFEVPPGHTSRGGSNGRATSTPQSGSSRQRPGAARPLSEREALQAEELAKFREQRRVAKQRDREILREKRRRAKAMGLYIGVEQAEAEERAKATERRRRRRRRRLVHVTYEEFVDQHGLDDPARHEKYNKLARRLQTWFRRKMRAALLVSSILEEEQRLRGRKKIKEILVYMVFLVCFSAVYIWAVEDQGKLAP